jgi:type VI secretion system ImpM family protein
MNSSIPPQAWVPVDEQIGWYGKLPAAGDFLYRRMPRELQAWWDRWMQNGLGSFKRWPDAMTRHYAVAPIWNFAIPATQGVNAVQFGCIAPSCDRVGRYYPVCVTLQVVCFELPPAVLEGSAAWYWQCGTALLQAIRHGVAPDQFDGQVLAAGAPAFRPPVAARTTSFRSSGLQPLTRAPSSAWAGPSFHCASIPSAAPATGGPTRPTGRRCEPRRMAAASTHRCFQIVFAGTCAMGMTIGNDKSHEEDPATAAGGEEA